MIDNVCNVFFCRPSFILEKRRLVVPSIQFNSILQSLQSSTSSSSTIYFYLKLCQFPFELFLLAGFIQLPECVTANIHTYVANKIHTRNSHIQQNVSNKESESNI